MKNTLLWIAAVILMVAAAVFQRMTGPTYPYKGNLDIGGTEYAYRLIRSSETTGGARVVLRNPDGALDATLHYRRYPTHDSLAATPFVLEGDEWAAYLPVQPAAGKMEYFVTLSIDGTEAQIPTEGEENIILRYKDPVPLGVLLPHVIVMFLSMLIGMRAGLAALFRSQDMRVLTSVALVGMTVGGMILGPIVQKYAFDAYWTGFPFGGDLTDNKTLIMWVSWIVAAWVVASNRIRREMLRRGIVVTAAVVMMVVYLIPHSLRGSELDYERIERVELRAD
jgi:hypothetical protein